MKEIILASKSPRRHELLNLLGIDHKVIPCKEDEKEVKNNNAEYDESIQITSIEEQILEVAKQKVYCVEKLLPKDGTDYLIIGADTIVVIEDEIIGKPKSSDDAVLMLQKIMGHIHDVFTGLFILDTKTGSSFTGIEKTRVSMLLPSLNKIKAYIQAENVLDKAGAYAIQGKGAAFIDWIDGCFYNVMGLPLSKIVSLLEQAGYEYLK
ncbi:MAG: septum formation protein Maf [Asgard group archaeon]|nr:septum formation protein Maf [Asgard group archaeon]